MNKMLHYAATGIIALIIFSFSVTNMASLYIVSALGGDQWLSHYAISFFGLANCLAMPLALPLSARFGKVRVLKFGLFAFTLLSFLLSTAQTYPFFVALRFLQGFASGPLFIIVPSILSKLASEEMIDHFIRSVTIVFVTASVIGAAVGGTIAYETNWTWIFYLNGMLLVLFSYFMLRAIRGITFERESRPFDLLSYLFFFLALGLLGFFFIMGQELDWFRSRILTLFFVASLISALYFIVRVRKEPYPLLRFSLLKCPPIAFALIQLSFLFSAYFGMVYLLSIWLNQYVRYTPNWVAVVLGTMAVTSLSLMIFIQNIKKKNSLLILLIALLFLAFSCYQTMNFDVDVDFKRIALSRIVAGVGLALFLPPLFHLVLNSCPRGEEFDGLLLFQMTRTLASGIGVALYATIWQRRDVFYHSRLGGALTAFSEKTGEFFDLTKMFGVRGLAQEALLEVALERQSQSLAINDCFYLMGLIMGGLTLLLILFYLKENFSLK